MLFVMPTLLREKGCPATSEKDFLLLARGELDTRVAEDLLLLMAQFQTLYERWSAYASLNAKQSAHVQSRVAFYRQELQTAKRDV